jgi:transposase
MSRHGSNYPPELRERAVRMVAEVQSEYPSQWAAIGAVASKLGIGSAERPGHGVQGAVHRTGREPVGRVSRRCRAVRPSGG